MDTKFYFMISGFLFFFVFVFVVFFYYFKTRREFYDDKKYDDKKYDFHNSKKWIWEYPSFLSQSECRDIIQLAKKQGLQKSQVKDFNVNNNYRISETAWLSPSQHTLVFDIFDKIEKMMNISKKNFELLQIVHYYPNGFFKWHYDQCNDKEKWCQKEIHRLKGYRLFTILIYLNDDYTGGITQFKYYKNKKYTQGDAVIFRNINTDTCQIESKSYHQGSPITSGEKWICNIWIRFDCNQKKK
jgi:prolyl 4-hydroxylase